MINSSRRATANSRSDKPKLPTNQFILTKDETSLTCACNLVLKLGGGVRHEFDRQTMFVTVLVNS